MYDFTYHRPTTVRQVANLLAKNEDAKLLAGGHSLIPVMKLRLAKPTSAENTDVSQMSRRTDLVPLNQKVATIPHCARSSSYSRSTAKPDRFATGTGSRLTNAQLPPKGSVTTVMRSSS